NRRATKVAEKFGKPLVATSDAHQLSAFGRHYTIIPRPSPLTAESIFAELRAGRLRINSPAATLQEIISTFYFVFIEHPLRSRFHHHEHLSLRPSQARNLTSKGQGARWPHSQDGCATLAGA